MEVYGINYLKIARIIGKPYKLDSVPPETFNCWTLIGFVYPQAPSFEPEELKEFIKMFNEQPEKLEKNRTWTEVERPIEGDIILFAKNNYYSHAGIFLEPDRVLHANETSGVIIEAFSMLKLRYKNIKAYRWQ